MHKTITTRPQSQLKPIFKTLLRPVAALVLSVVEIAEWIDAQLRRYMANARSLLQLLLCGNTSIFDIRF